MPILDNQSRHDANRSRNASAEDAAHRAVNGVIEPEIRMIRIRNVRVNPNQPRTIFDMNFIGDLKNSIEANGVLTPIQVRPLKDDPLFGEVYELIAGEQRTRAAQMANLEYIPAIIHQVSEKKAWELAVSENVDRDDLTLYDLCRDIAITKDAYGYSFPEVAKIFRKGKKEVENRYYAWKAGEDCQQLLKDHPDTLSHVLAIKEIKDNPEFRKKLIREAAKGASVVKLREMIAASRPTATPKTPTVAQVAKERQNAPQTGTTPQLQPTPQPTSQSAPQPTPAPQDADVSFEELVALSEENEAAEAAQSQAEAARIASLFDLPEEPQWTAESLSLNLQSSLKTLQNAAGKVETVKARSDYTPLAREGILKTLSLIEAQLSSLKTSV